jgi:hypothetical protein
MFEFGSFSANALYGGFDVPVVTGATGPVVSLPAAEHHNKRELLKKRI